MASAVLKTAKVHSNIYTVPYDSLAVEEGFNIRENYDLDGLAQTIKARGVLEPLRVRPAQGSEDKTKVYITNGHHRYYAIPIAIEKYKAESSIKNSIKVIYEDKGANEETRSADIILLNSGKALNALEQAKVMKRLIDYGMKINIIAEQIGKPQKEIRRLLELNSTPLILRQAVLNNIISPTAAIELSKADEGAQKKVLSKINTLMTKVENVQNAGDAKAEPKASKGDAKDKKAEDKGEKKASKKKIPAISIKEVQKATGKQTQFSLNEIKEIRSKVQAIWRSSDEPQKSFWEAALYGINIIMGEELKPNKFDDFGI
jgi:ParB family transcriptional regulator, chromosome partitioning protein